MIAFIRKETIMKKTLRTLKTLLNDNRITKQQYRTYKGQVLAGDIEGCLKGLQKKRLVKGVDG